MFSTSPAASRNRMMTSPALLSAAAILSGVMCAAAQDYGSHTLPANLADPATKIEGVMNKDPLNASRKMGYCEGPAADANGNVFFTEDIGTNGNIWKVTAQGVGSRFYSGPALPNGMEFDPQGKLVACENNSISFYDTNGMRTPLTMTGSPELKRVNDVSISSKGAMFFTNHGTGNTFFYRSPEGEVTSYNESLTPAVGLKIPNGIEYIEEKKMLLVNSDGAAKVYRFDVADDGKVSNKTEFASVAEPDGLTVDELGNIYIASYNDGAINVFDPTGKKLLGKITVKGDGNQSGNTSNCVFGVSDKCLYITGDGGLFKLRMKVGPRVRPGSTGLSHPAGITLAPAARSVGAIYDLAGRRVEVRMPAALRLLTSPLSR